MSARVCKRRRLTLGLSGLLLAVSVSWLWVRTLSEDTCRHAVVESLPSPDGAWEVVVDEAVCEGGGFATAIVAGVRLASTRASGQGTTLLGVDTGGHENERPRPVWADPNVLRVTVPNLSYLKVLRCDFGGVRVDLRFDPDDPEARAAWRRKRGMSPERDCTDEAR